MIRGLLEGLGALRRSWGLVVLLWAANVLLAAILAVPFVGVMEAELEERGAGRTMMYGFDYDFWSEWSERQSGWTKGFGPDLFGKGLLAKNLDLALRGELPARAFVSPEARSERGTDAVILALGLAYMLLHAFLSGGVLGVLRSAQGHWKVRSLLHGSGFYFGRMVRLGGLALIAAWIVFQLYAPVARWIEGQARESVSGGTAHVFLLARYGGLLGALMLAHMVASYAKVILVIEERSSALLAYASSLSFCVMHPIRTLGHTLLVLLGAIALFGVWNLLDTSWVTTGYKTQLGAAALGQFLVLGVIGLRLAWLGGQLAIYRDAGARSQD